MSKDKTKQPLLQSKDECHSLLSVYSISAMRLRKLGDHHTAYPEQIVSLAKVCAHLITAYSEKPEAVITQMEHSLATELKNELKIIDSEITTLFNRRKKSTPNTLYGEKEIVDLTLQISTLKRRKAIPMAEIIQRVICDTFNQISIDHGAILLGNFNPDGYEYHDESVNQLSEHSGMQAATPNK